MPPEMNQEMLDLMTPEERAAIEDNEYSPEELAAMKGIAGDDDSDDDDEDDDQPAAEQKPAEEKADEPPAVEESADSPAPEKDEGEFKPRYKAELPADFADQVSALNTEMSGLAQQLRDGDIDFDEYNTKQGELLAKRDELNAVKLKADIAADMGAQNVEQEWEFTVKRFVKATAKSDGIDYSKDAAKQKDLDLFVKALASENGNANQSFDWFLAEAHKRVKALHGIAAKKSEDPEKPNRKTPVNDIPKTLAQVPGGDGPGDVSDEFSNLDGLEGLALEDAIAKMSPAQRERYLQAA